MAVLYEWNPGDGVGDWDGSPEFESGLSGGALSEESDSDVIGGAKLRMSAGGTGTGCSIVLLTAPIVQAGAGNLVIDFELVNQSSQYGGFAFLAGDDGSSQFHALTYMIQGWKGRVDADSFSSDGNTNNGMILAGRAGRGRIYLRADQPAAAAPRVELRGQAVYQGSPPGGSSCVQDEMALNTADYAAISAFPSSWWGSATLNRLGLCLQATGGSSPGIMDLAYLRVSDDPLAFSGSGDTTAPVVTPAVVSGSAIGRMDAVVVDVTDDTALGTAVLMVELGGGPYEVIWDGARFASYYSTSTRALISGGYRYTIRRTGGWVGAPTFRAVAVDTAGNESV